MEKYLEIDYSSPIKIIIKDESILPYIKKLLEDNFKFKIVVEELSLTAHTYAYILELSNEVNSETFNRHFSVITEDVLKEHSKQ